MKRDALTLVAGGAVCYLIVNILYPFVSSQQDKASPSPITVAPHECDCENEYYRRELHKRWSELATTSTEASYRLIAIRGEIQQIRIDRRLSNSLLGGSSSVEDYQRLEVETKDRKVLEAELRAEMYMLHGKLRANVLSFAGISVELHKLGDNSKDSMFVYFKVDEKSQSESLQNLDSPLGRLGL